MANYSKFPLREENREVSWDQHNYVCDQEVEKISERMSKMPSINDAAIEGGGVEAIITSQVQSCPNDVGLPSQEIDNSPNICLPVTRQIVPNTTYPIAPRQYENLHQHPTQHYYLMVDQSHSRDGIHMSPSVDPNSLYSNIAQINMMKKQLVSTSQTGIPIPVSTGLMNATEAVNNQAHLRSQIYSNTTPLQVRLILQSCI